jgi:hypothetical protein
VRGCRYTKLIDSRYRYNRYRYHKNAIINKDISPLVGIDVSLAVRACLSIAGIMSSLYSHLDPLAEFNCDHDPRYGVTTYLRDLFVSPLDTLASYLYARVGHEPASVRSMCPCMVTS